MITGLNGCSCHPFLSWDECKKAHRQKFKVGDPVKNLCSGRDGTINKVEKQSGYVSVKYGPIPRDIEGEHVAQLIKIQS